MSIKLKILINNYVLSPCPANPVLNSFSNLDQALDILKKKFNTCSRCCF